MGGSSGMRNFGEKAHFLEVGRSSDEEFEPGYEQLQRTISDKGHKRFKQHHARKKKHAMIGFLFVACCFMWARFYLCTTLLGNMVKPAPPAPVEESGYTYEGMKKSVSSVASSAKTKLQSAAVATAAAVGDAAEYVEKKLQGAGQGEKKQ